jgi:aldose 1-epimerase
VPTGELVGVEGSPFDFRTPRRIGARIAELEATPARGYDLCYALDAPSLAAPVARLRDPRSGRTLELFTDQPGLQLYTGNRLDGFAGKRGAPCPRFGGVCLETQRFPDAVHHAHFPTVLLRPGETYLSTTVWLFSAE